MRLRVPWLLALPLLLGAFDWAGKLLAAAEGLKAPDPKRRVHAIQDLAGGDIEATKPYLLPVLDDPSPEVRLAAAVVLGKAKVEETVEKVAEWLSSPDKTVRVAAAGVLGDIASPRAVAALTRTLVDSEADVRRAAVEALGRIGGKDVAAALAARLDDDSALVRRAAAQELLACGDKRSVIPLLERFDDTSREVRVAAIEAVGRLGDPNATSALLRLLVDPMEEVRIAAVEALGNLRATSAVAELIPLLDRFGDEFRAKVALALGQIGDPAAVRALVQALEKESVRPAAREALLLAGSRALAPLVECLGGHLDCDPASAVSILSALKDRQATPALLAELHKNRVPLEVLVDALGHLADPGAFLPLLALAGNPSLEVRRKVMRALEPIVDGRGADVLIHALADEDPLVRSLAARYLGRLRSRAAVPALLALAGPTSPEPVRAEAIRALGSIGDRRATSRLLSLISSRDPAVRREAATALALLRDPTSIPSLLALVESKESLFQSEALTALQGVLRRTPHLAAGHLMTAIARGESTALSLGAIDVLSAMQDRGSLPVLMEIAREPSRHLAPKALEALGNFGGTRAVPLLVEKVLGDDTVSQAAAAWSLGKLSGVPMDPLLRAARSRDLCTAINATAALSRVATPLAHADALFLASHGHPLVRANASLLLARMGGDEAHKRLTEIADRDVSPYARASAVLALGASGDTEPARRAIEKESDSWVRAASARVLEHGSGRQPRDSFARAYFTSEDGMPLKHERYVFVDPTGLVKCGTTDMRGEASEEQFPDGPWAYEILDSRGNAQPLK
ncbi:MAG: HEAT repeat domain-containing protein [Deltaproteobacteria bacterium]|nr:HEAT repeat domain-containing protein [Deltaproteobacteria bacterium]